MLLIGLSGKKQSGKDTSAEIIQQLAGSAYDYYRIAFADSLYEEIAEMLLKNEGRIITRQRLLSFIKHIKSNKDQYRLLLQWWGTEYRRNQDTDYWIKKWHKKLQDLNPADNTLVVATDVRFPNEYETIRNCGGYVWRISRFPNPTYNDFHESETSLDGYDVNLMIDNSTTLDKLKINTKLALQQTISQHNNKLLTTTK